MKFPKEIIVTIVDAGNDGKCLAVMGGIQDCEDGDSVAIYRMTKVGVVGKRAEFCNAPVKRKRLKR